MYYFRYLIKPIHNKDIHSVNVTHLNFTMHLTVHMPHRPRKQTPFMHHLRKNTTNERYNVWSRNLRIFITIFYTRNVSSYRFPIPSSFFDVNQLEWINFESIFILLTAHLLTTKEQTLCLAGLWSDNSYNCHASLNVKLMHHTSNIYTFLALFNIKRQCVSPLETSIYYKHYNKTNNRTPRKK